MAMNPGARMIGEGPGRKQTPSNLKSRQMLGPKTSWPLVGNEGINLYIGILGMKLQLEKKGSSKKP